MLQTQNQLIPDESVVALGVETSGGETAAVVVLFNQVTTKYSEGSYQLTLALVGMKEMRAHIDKSPSVRSAVTRRGIRNSTSSCKRVKMILQHLVIVLALAQIGHFCYSLKGNQAYH
ncbi:PREDICTED: DNA repair protein RAD51 homolog 3-like [Ipomoea nil]|uniref:DNA repair protein RAD51 homolog 3-like n=1 Tax=Ipomoea nil TaxID=35883 RepID=UPI000900D56D|nr:PREDICTED: DNA repair protein RAD51 homolog 3-like [Ipomoea nil]